MKKSLTLLLAALTLLTGCRDDGSGNSTVITFSKASLTISVGGMDINTAKASSGAVVTYSAEAPSIASVDSNSGLVTGVSEGTTRITASCTGATNSYTVTVTASGSANTGDTGSSTVDPTSEDDRIASNFAVSKTVNISWNGSAVTVTGDVNELVKVIKNENGKVEINNLDTESDIAYYLSGTCSDGYFKLYSSRKQAFFFNNLNLTNPNGAAINNQSKKRTFVVLMDGTSNYLADGTGYSTDNTEDERAAFFSEGQLCFSGNGSLTVKANGKSGIASDDYIRFLGGTYNITAGSSATHCIRGKEAVTVTAGNITATNNADTRKCVKSDGFYYQAGGTVILTSTGGTAYDSESKDYSSAACIKADGTFVMKDGSLTCTATGVGGKCINIDGDIRIEGGNIVADAKGGNYNTNVSYAKAIKTDAGILITGGKVSASSASYEGMTSDGPWTQTGGEVFVRGADDAINCGTNSSNANMTITGGYLHGYSTSNDGIDINGNLFISGGVVIGEGARAPEVGIDTKEGCKVIVSGGTTIARGGGLAEYTGSNVGFVTISSTTSGVSYGLQDASGNQIAAYTPSNSTGSITLFVSPAITSGSTYTLYKNVTFSPSYSVDPAYGSKYSGGSSAGTATATSSVEGHAGQGPGGQGGFPGRPF